jgi:hypothetical protein
MGGVRSRVVGNEKAPAREAGGGRGDRRGRRQPVGFFFLKLDLTLPKKSMSTPWVRMMMYCCKKVIVLLATQ